MNCFECEYFLESANSYKDDNLPECGHENAPQISGITDFNTAPDWCPEMKDTKHKQFNFRIAGHNGVRDTEETIRGVLAIEDKILEIYDGNGFIKKIYAEGYWYTVENIDQPE